MSDSTFPLRLKNSLKIFLPEKVLESAKSYFQFMFNKLGIFFYLEKAEKIEFLKTLRINFLQQTQMKKVFNGEVLRLRKINGCFLKDVISVPPFKSYLGHREEKVSGIAERLCLFFRACSPGFDSVCL